MLLVLRLYGVGKVETLGKILVLEHREHHITLWRRGVEALVVGVVLIVGLQQNIGILFLRHFEVGLALRETHHKSLHARRGFCGMRIGMDGDKEVGLGSVGYAGSLGEGNIGIGRTRKDNFHIGIVIRNQFAELGGNSKSDIFLPRATPVSPGFGPAMPRVYHHGANAVGFLFLRKSKSSNEDYRNK